LVVEGVLTHSPDRQKKTGGALRYVRRQVRVLKLKKGRKEKFSRTS